MGFNKFRLEPDGFPKRGDCPFEFALTAQCSAEIAMTLSKVWLDADDVSKRADRSIELALRVRQFA